MNKKKRIRGLEREIDGLGDCVAEWHLQLLSNMAALSGRIEGLEQARRVNVTVKPKTEPDYVVPDARTRWVYTGPTDTADD